MSYKQKELIAIKANEKADPEVVKNWTRQFELLLNDAREQGDVGRVQRLNDIYAIMNKNEVTK
jgi:hypothetical protein